MSNGKREIWNRCDVCGKFISIKDFESGEAIRNCTPDTEFTSEYYETFCKEHAPMTTTLPPERHK